jgi:uncharacterized phage-associated protein
MVLMERMVLVERTALSDASALRVADLFLVLSATEEEPDCVSPLRLQKLLYYAQAWSLAMRDRPLFREDIEAWIDGPVVPRVYARFAHDGDRCQISPSSPLVSLSADDDAFVRSVWRAYRNYSATALHYMAQYEDPWRLAHGGPSDGGEPGILTHESMKDYFAPQATAR